MTKDISFDSVRVPIRYPSGSSWRGDRSLVCFVEYKAIQNYLNKSIGLGLPNEELALALPWLGGAVDAEAT